MTGGITYDGVASDNGGNIFAGKSFWVAQRVPMRSSLLEQIKSNGGKVVPLEKNADMLIADHVRKDVPRGSYSWKFIQDSIGKGVVQLEDKYQIGWAPNVQRPAGSARPAKGTRTPYTAQDDAWLLQWVLKQKNAKSGNKAYMEFAELCPRHTWQSWRERYTKRLALLSPEEQRNLAESVPPMQDDVQNQAEPSRLPSVAPSPARAALTTKPKAEEDPDKTNVNTEDEEDQESESEGGSIAGEISDGAIKEQFYSDISDYMFNAEIQIDTWHTIGGKKLELWDLAQAAMSQNVATEELDWLKIAEDLGFNWVEDKACASQLRECYDANLADFVESMASFDSQRATQNVDRDEIPDSLSQPAVPSSPSPLVSGKRSLDAAEEPVKSAKRRRLSRDEEIPSTPRARPLAAGGQPLLQPQLSSVDVTPSQQLRDELLSSPTTAPTATSRKKAAPVHTQSKATTPNKKPAPSNNDQEINKWVEHYEALGYSNRIVVRALKATSMTPGWPASYAMQNLQNGDGMPSNAEGIWTDRDDEALRLVNGTDLNKEPASKQETLFINKIKRKVKRLLEKHGQAKMDLRTRFLAAQDQEKASPARR